MNVIALLLIVLLAQETDVVKAASDAKATRGKTTKKVITNADVKKAKSSLGTTKPAPIANAPKPAKSEDEIFHARVDAEAKVAAAVKKMNDLERQLVLDEQSYYDEGDPNTRDTVIKQRFEATQAKVAEARKELEAAQSALAALEGRTPSSALAAKPR